MAAAAIVPTGTATTTSSTTPLHHDSLGWHLCSRLVSSWYNWQGHRTYPATLWTRQRGFTETWGDSSEDTTDGDGLNKNDVASWRIIPDDFVSEQVPHPYYYHYYHSVASSSTTKGHIMMLHQFRPAWLEQLALRIAKLPHWVVNQPYRTFAHAHGMADGGCTRHGGTGIAQSFSIVLFGHFGDSRIYYYYYQQYYTDCW
jgi:hypothetical protein